jgi:hypothetical protein
MHVSDFCTITSFFNPAGYKRRLENFLRFREHLCAQLIVAEMSMDGTFVVPSDQRTKVIRVRGTDVMWHKESLLNLALDHVPLTVKYIAWLDCDVILERQDWLLGAKALLGRHSLVQLFTDLHDLPKEGALEPIPPRTGQGIASLITDGAPLETAFRPTKSLHMRQSSFGLAWAARADPLREH